MDFVEGKSLAQLVREHPLPPADAARCVKTVAEAIQFAHARGVLHRDLKPSNVMLGAGGTPRVMDFGLAKLLAGDSELTQSGAAMGSPGYMPPEQALGRAGEVGVRSDVYALGGILYELLTGRPPFRAATPVETLKLVTEQEPVPPRALNRRLPRDLETICLKCLEKSPGRRYATAQELAEELGRYLNDEPIRARPAGPAEKLWRWCRRKPALSASLASSLLLLLALTVVSATTAARVQRESDRTRIAKRDAEEKLWASYLAQARAGRLSGVAGRRADSLAAVTAAARMKPSLALRNEAIACLALSDLGATQFWRDFPENQPPSLIAWDASMERVAVGEATRRLTVERPFAPARSPSPGTEGLNEVLAEFRLPGVYLRSAKFSPDGRHLAAAAADGRVRLFVLQPAPARAEAVFPAVLNQANTMSFHPDGQWLALLGRDQQVHVIDVEGGERAPSIRLEAAAADIAFSPAGDKLAVAAGFEIRCWKWPGLEPLKTFKHGSRVSCLAWSPDGRTLAAGDVLGGLVGWDTELNNYVTLPAHSLHVSQVSFHPDGDVVVSHGYDGLSRFWDAASARQLFASSGGLAMHFSRDGRRLAFHREAVGFGAWEFTRSRSFQTLTAHLPVAEADISPDGRWLAYAEATGWRLWDVASRKELLYVPLPRARSPMFHPRGQDVLVVTPDEIIRWPLRAGAEGVQLGAPVTLASAKGKDLHRVSFSADGARVAVAGRYGSFALDWDEPARVTEYSLQAMQSYVVVSPDGQWIVSTTHNGIGVALWNRQGELARLLVTNENCMAAFSADGRSLVTTSSRDYSFWDTQTWQVRRKVTLDLGSAVAGPIAFSRNGRLLAVAANRCEIRLLQPETGEELATLTAPDSQNLMRVAFSADGSRLVATTVARAIQVWDLRTLRRELAAMGLDW
jgi:WD40 repeat protein